MESDKSHKRLSLAEAQRTGRLEEFISQEEARGIGPIDRTALDRLLGKAVKATQSKDQPSHSSSREG